MDNPFPDMDPYMEQQWGDAHHSVITYARDQLRTVLPPDLRPRVEERVFVEDQTDDTGRRRLPVPDLRVVEHVRAGPLPRVAGGGVATAEPLTVELEYEPITEGFIQIVDARSGNRVVTVIEVLSPMNKRPGGEQELFLRKVNECREAKVNLVEIHLLRGGTRGMLCPEDFVPPSHRTPYRVCVWRAARPSRCELYAVPLRERLPAIRVPLRETDADAPLDLQPLIDQAYRNGS